MDIFLRFLPRLAEMHMHINEPRRHHQALSVKHFHITFRDGDFLCYFLNLSILYEDISHFMLLFCGIYNGSVFN